MKKIFCFVFFCVLSVRVSAQCTTASTVPYFEGFSSVNSPTQLPLCWAVSNTVTCYTMANKAVFYYLPNGSNYFYSGAIHLQAGMVYSVSIWYKLLQTTTLTWSNLSISLGTTQSSVGLTTLASVSNPANTSFTPLSNTFVVSSTGDYYVAINGVSFATGGSLALTWDDLSIIIPCTPEINSPVVSLSSSSDVVCSGRQATVVASGADSYLWHTAATSNSLLTWGGTLSVTGTNTLTGCISTASIHVPVIPSPNLGIFADRYSICRGESVNLSAYGAYFYYWNDGQLSPMITVTPTITTTYSITGTSSQGCSTEGTQLITVHPLPTVNVVGIPSVSCVGEQVSLTATGAQTIEWGSATNGYYQGKNLKIKVKAAVTFSVWGIDTNSCSSTVLYTLKVNECTGLTDGVEVSEVWQLYPNPGKGDYILESRSTEDKKISITDLSGKQVFAVTSAEADVPIDLTAFAPGIYLVRVQTLHQERQLKLVKY